MNHERALKKATLYNLSCELFGVLAKFCFVCPNVWHLLWSTTTNQKRGAFEILMMMVVSRGELNDQYESVSTQRINCRQLVHWYARIRFVYTVQIYREIHLETWKHIWKTFESYVTILECSQFDYTKNYRFCPGTPISFCRSIWTIRDDPYWTYGREDSLQLIELSSINIVSLVLV